MSRHYDSVSSLTFVAEPLTSITGFANIYYEIGFIWTYNMLWLLKNLNCNPEYILKQTTFDTWIVRIFVMVDFEMVCNVLLIYFELYLPFLKQSNANNAKVD